MNESFLQQILDSIADGVFTVNLEGRITSFNRSAQKITGFSREEAVGQYCFDIFRTDICEAGCPLDESMKSGKQIVDRTATILAKDGREVPINMSTAVLRDKSDEIVGGAETFRDLSAIEELRRELLGKYSFGDIVSKNKKIQEILAILPDMAESTSTVLIEGPSGSGKELFARAIHDLSPRKDKPYVKVNCGALPETLLESELFGYRKGAFTDARTDKPGRFDLADGGTIFLDEIGDLAMSLQVKLLRVLQERTFEPLGATETVKVDVRVIAATNRKLADLVARREFREDLYYRLNVIRIELPPLAERREDIPLLIDHFVRRFNAVTGEDVRALSREAVELLMRHDFPGNVRELENAIEHAFVLCRGKTIEPRHLPAEIARSKKAASTGRADVLREAEAQALRTALERVGGNRERAARELGIHRVTLWRKMRRYGLI